MRAKWIAFGALATLTALSLMAATSGGFPANPRFQSVTVTKAAGNQSSIFTASDGLTGSTSRIGAQAGTVNFSLFAAPTAQASSIVTNGPTGAQGVLRMLGNSPLVFGVNNTRHAQLDPGDWSVYGTTTGVANQSWVSFRDSAGTENAYVGDGSNSNQNLELVNNVTDAGIRLATAGTQGGTTGVTINGFRAHGSCTLSFVLGASPSLNGGSCGDPGVAVSNTGTGLYTLTHNLNTAAYIAFCQYRDNTPTLQHVVTRSLSSTNVTLGVYSSAGALTNSGSNVHCLFMVSH